VKYFETMSPTIYPEVVPNALALWRRHGFVFPLSPSCLAAISPLFCALCRKCRESKTTREAVVVQCEQTPDFATTEAKMS